MVTNLDKFNIINDCSYALDFLENEDGDTDSYVLKDEYIAIINDSYPPENINGKRIILDEELIEDCYSLYIYYDVEDAYVPTEYQLFFSDDEIDSNGKIIFYKDKYYDTDGNKMLLINKDNKDLLRYIMNITL